MICDRCERTWPLEANYCANCGDELRVPSGNQWRMQRAEREQGARPRAVYSQRLFWLTGILGIIGVGLGTIYAIASFALGQYAEAAASFVAAWTLAVIFRASWVCADEALAVPKIGIVLDTSLYYFYGIASFGSLGVAGVAIGTSLSQGLLRWVALLVVMWLVTGAIFFYRRWKRRAVRREVLSTLPLLE